MDKENGDGGEAAGKPPESILDAAGLFGAYWGRDGGANSAAAQAQAQAQAALFGFGGRYPQPSTLGVAANQAASLGLHPAASAAWWSMASHLAAQDYLSRLQASGLSFPSLGDPYAALSALSAGVKQPSNPQKSHSRNDGSRSGRSSASSTTGPKETKSPSVSSAGSQSSMRPSSYGFPKTSSPSTMQSGSLSSLASLNSLVGSQHQSKSSKQTQSTPSRKPPSSTASSSVGQSSSKGRDRDMSYLRNDLMLAQAAAHTAYQAAVAHASSRKNMSPLYPYGMPGSDKDRHGGIDSLTGLPHNLLSDPSAVLGGVRLPPDTEIIKYTSSLAGPKAPPGSTNRGRKKTISLDPPQVSVHPATERSTPTPSKRPKVDDYGNSRSSVEVIRLPNKPDRSSSIASTPPPNLSDYAGISRELLQTIASQSGVSLAALEKQLAGSTSLSKDPGMNLSTKLPAPSDESLELSTKTASNDEDAPLNLSLKPNKQSSSLQSSDALSRLTSLSSSLSAAANNDRISRRKPGNKPRRVIPELNSQIADSPRPKSSGSEDSESLPTWPSREGRPRNLGRGVSKPKKNTVASLLAQSRALGLRPSLAHHLLPDTDMEKLKALLGDTVSTDSECPSDSPSDSDASDTSATTPLALGWKRLTIIKGLSRNCNIKGDVFYTPPDSSSNVKLKSRDELIQFLEQNPAPGVTADMFSFNSRVILGDYAMSPELGEPTVFGEQELLKRLEEARALVALTSGRPTPPPLDKRIELARRQQAARDAKRDATHRHRDQARLVKEYERSEKAEMAKRDKEVKSQQLLEAKKKKQEEIEKQRLEEQVKRQQERELKRQQAMIYKEQERERRRQHTTLIRQLDCRRRWEERERRKHQNLLDRLLVKERKLQQRRKEMELLSELRRPQEDSTLSDQKKLPELDRIPGLKLSGAAMADLLQVFEFIHNFGASLGLDMENLPSLNTLQMGLLTDFNADAEYELIQLLGQLLAFAMEDPGIPHPFRHTTLLGQGIRITGDITSSNFSEILRIYLYANATGEVKSLTGLSVERERERRIADHHQTDAEMLQTQANTKNQAYYDTLHNNNTYKLSETLRDKPFLALNPTTKARILAFICDELLQSKLVLRQIDGSLENLNQLRKERYLMDMKIRKARVQYQRKCRAEQTEKQQAMALERMQKLVEESTTNTSSSHVPYDENPPSNATEKTESPTKEATAIDNNDKEDNSELPSPYKDSQNNSSDKELSPLKDVSNNMKSKEVMNNNKDECSPADNSKIDKDSVMGDCDAILSDLESEGTQPEEDEDRNLSSEELGKKLEKLLRQSEIQLQQLHSGTHELRATCYGQDRYWRRYWSFGKCGGIFVEAMESTQPELLNYQEALENKALELKVEAEKKAAKENEKTEVDTEAQKQEALKTEMELKSIKSELNLSDHTQIIKYEPNVNHGNCKIEGSSIKMEEKYIQKQNSEEQDMLDIEDSIPTAFLVQKPTHTPMFATQAETVDKPQEIIKVENVVKSEDAEKPVEESKDDIINNLEELRKLAEAVSSQLDKEKQAEQELENSKLKQDDDHIQDNSSELMMENEANSFLYTRMLEGKWFSILRHENSFLENINEIMDSKNEDRIPLYCDNEHTCVEVVTSQGHKWDVSNNLHLLNDPSLFTLNSMVTSVQVPSNNFYPDSTLTMSGLDQSMMDAVMKEKGDEHTENEKSNKDMENDLEKELQADLQKQDLAVQKAKASSLTSLGLLNFNALSTYVTCDSPPPIQMTPDETDQLEHCKVHGIPNKKDCTFLSTPLRYGWWRITDPNQLKELVDNLHPRGVRERELYAAFMQQYNINHNKFIIEKGDTQNTTLSLSHLDQIIAENEGYPRPDTPGSFSAMTARRNDMQLLSMVEQLEERVAAASMLVSSWRPSEMELPEEATGAEIVAFARHMLASIEAHIERRYLKPPLVQRYASTSEAAIGAAMQGEQSNTSASSPQNNDMCTDGRDKEKGISRGLSVWREAVSRCNTSAQLAMALQALEAGIAWDKSIMKANCQFCLCGDNEGELLLCDGCDKGYHTYCFKPRMDKIPEGDWYCWECVNKARGERVCIVCGGSASGRTVSCALCPKAYHLQCHTPPMGKTPRGKWYCNQCIVKAPIRKPRPAKKRDGKQKDKDGSFDMDVPSPAPSHASTTTAEDSALAEVPDTPERPSVQNGINHQPTPSEFSPEDGPPPEKRSRTLQFVDENGAAPQEVEQMEVDIPADDPEQQGENFTQLNKAKKDKTNAKPVQKQLQMCRTLLLGMERHKQAWPFLIPVNTKHFPQYKKVIKFPMDLSTIRKKFQDNAYKTKEDFVADVRLMFSNCEIFNEDDSPVGRAGHDMRQFFEEMFEQI